MPSIQWDYEFMPLRDECPVCNKEECDKDKNLTHQAKP